MVMQRLEKALGLPQLTQVADSLEKFPDARQLKLIKDVLTIAERLSQSAPELDQVVAIVREINSAPIEKLDKVEKILKQANKLIANAPQDLLQFLSSLKEE